MLDHVFSDALRSAVQSVFDYWRRPVADEESSGVRYQFEVVLAWRITMVALALVLVMLLVTVGLLLHDSELVLFVVYFVAGLAVCAWFVNDAFFRRLLADETGLYLFSPFGSKFISWISVKTLNETALGVTVSDGATTIRFGIVRHGLVTLSRLAKANLPDQIKGRAHLIAK